MSGRRVLALYAMILLGFAVVLCRLYLLAQNGVNEMSGARNLRRVIAQRVEDPVSELVLRGKGRNGIYSAENGNFTLFD